MAQRGDPLEVRKSGLNLVEGGRKLAEIAADLGGSERTIYSWWRQARIDAGIEAGLSTTERAELTSAKRRIRQLETEGVSARSRSSRMLIDQGFIRAVTLISARAPGMTSSVMPIQVEAGYGSLMNSSFALAIAAAFFCRSTM
jgi:transposase